LNLQLPNHIETPCIVDICFSLLFFSFLFFCYLSAAYLLPPVARGERGKKCSSLKIHAGFWQRDFKRISPKLRLLD
jgi:hypothetical protein